LAAPLLGLLLMAPMLKIQVQSATFALPKLGAAESGRDPALATAEGTLLRFGTLVREATPTTSGFLDPGKRAEYGIITYPIMGHVFQWVSRRPTTADNFGPYLLDSNLADTQRFYRLQDEADAVDLARDLRARYVVSADLNPRDPRRIGHRLYHQDGRSPRATEQLTHFRLVTEGPVGGRSVASLAGRLPRKIPYKLFEIVEGALLRVHTRAGGNVSAEIPLVSPTGREFVYRSRALADEAGEVLLRVPYSTDRLAPVHARGPYIVRSEGNTQTLEVEEEDVLEGRVIELRLTPRD